MSAQTVATINSQLGGQPMSPKIISENPHGGTAGSSYYVLGGTTYPGSAMWVDCLTTDTAEQCVTKIQAALPVRK